LPQINSIVATHPSVDGWKVYECDRRYAEKMTLAYLLDYVRDNHPHVLKRRFALKNIDGHHLSDSIEVGSEWDTQKELNADGWLGVVEIEWQGEPIHYYSFDMRAYGSDDTIFVIATKSNAALRNFLNGLSAYGHAREIPKPQVTVINGLNCPIPNVSWDDLILPPGIAKEIRGNVESFFAGRKWYQELGIPYRRGFLFTGPPGNGKTMTVKALANTTQAKFITVLTAATVRDSDIYRAFYVAEKHSPAVVLFEDLDKLVQSDTVSLSLFLNLLDGLKVLDGVLIIATSNDPSKLDPALLHRPSRFDRVWNFPLPNYEQRYALLVKKGRGYFSMPVLEEVAHKSNGFTMAYTGRHPDDASFLSSFKALKTQRKAASKETEDIADRENLGFRPQVGERRMFPMFLDDEDEECLKS
jgi:hypothetical protein